MRRHLVRVVVEKAPDRLLWDFVIDKPCPIGMAPLMRGHVDETAELVADVAGEKPNDDLSPEGRIAERHLTVGVTSPAGQQAGAVGEFLHDSTLLNTDGFGQVGIDRDKGLAPHLVVPVAQERCSLTVTNETVKRQPASVSDPKARSHQDPKEQATAEISESLQVLLVLQLAHHDLRQCPREGGV